MTYNSKCICEMYLKYSKYILNSSIPLVLPLWHLMGNVKKLPDANIDSLDSLDSFTEGEREVV